MADTTKVIDLEDGGKAIEVPTGTKTFTHVELLKKQGVLKSQVASFTKHLEEANTELAAVNLLLADIDTVIDSEKTAEEELEK